MVFLVLVLSVRKFCECNDGYYYRNGQVLSLVCLKHFFSLFLSDGWQRLQMLWYARCDWVVEVSGTHWPEQQPNIHHNFVVK